SQMGSTAAMPARWAMRDFDAMCHSLSRGAFHTCLQARNEVRRPSQCAAGARDPVRSQGSRGRTILGLRLERSHGHREEVSHGLAQLDLCDGHALIVEVLLHLAEHVLVALLNQVRLAHGLDVFVHLRPGEAQLLSRPLRQQPVAARLSAELELLVQGEFLLEGSFPLIEAGHGLISTGSARSRDVPAPRAICEALPDGAVAINRCRLRRWSSKPWCDNAGWAVPPALGPTAAGGDLAVDWAHGPAPATDPVDRPPWTDPVDRPPGPAPWTGHVACAPRQVFRLFPDRRSATVRASLQARAQPSSCAAACGNALQFQRSHCP